MDPLDLRAIVRCRHTPRSGAGASRMRSVTPGSLGHPKPWVDGALQVDRLTVYLWHVFGIGRLRVAQSIYPSLRVQLGGWPTCVNITVDTNFRLVEWMGFPNVLRYMPPGLPDASTTTCILLCFMQLQWRQQSFQICCHSRFQPYKSFCWFCRGVSEGQEQATLGPLSTAVNGERLNL